MIVISSALTTFLTIAAGPTVSGVVLLWHKFYVGGRTDTELATTLLSNIVALVPILCLILNMLAATFHASFVKAADAATITSKISESATHYGDMIRGNEVTFTLALMYATLMILVSIYRNLRAARPGPAE